MGEKRVFPTQAAEYDLLEEIGRGAYAVVYRAICKPLDQVVAIKCMDLEACNCSLESVSKEAQLMSLIDHPNVMKAYCSFNVDHFLWVVMPYMDGGSCLHIMKVSYPDGLEESVIATILKETLKGLDYLHQQQQIHRDVKAGNILVDANGAVKLGDFGTSAYMFGRGDGQRSRNTFTGTPCWMAPEVMEQMHGYDFRADIWSFGITALELAHGHAPFSKYPPMKVLLMTIHNAAPGLDHERDKRFSKAFREIVKLCLNKDPSKRPTTEKLLKHPFFRHTKYNSSVVQKLLNGLGPLWEREKILRDKDAVLLASKKPAFLEEEERSRDEYKRGVSSWNFDIESLKGQAAMIPEEDDVSSIGDEDAVPRATFGKESEDSSKITSQVLSPSAKNIRQPLTLNTCQIGQRSWLSEKKEPKQIGRFGVFDGDLELESPGWHEVVRQTKYVEDQHKGQKLPTIAEDKGRNGLNDKGFEAFEASTIPLPSSSFLDEKSSERNLDHDISEEAVEEMLNLSTEKDDSVGVVGGLVSHEQAASSSSIASMESFEEKHKGDSVMRKSCSAVTSMDASLTQSMELKKSLSVGDCSLSTEQKSPSDSLILSSNIFDASSVPASLLVPQIKGLLLQAAKQYETLANMLKIASPGEAINVSPWLGHNKSSKEGEAHTMGSSMDPDLDLEHPQVRELQSKVTSLTKELVSMKFRNIQLERQLNAIYNRQEEERIRKEEAEKEYM